MYKFWRCVAMRSIYINATRRCNELACASKPPVMQMVLFLSETPGTLWLPWCCQVGAAGIASSWYCRNGAAKLAASWARLTILAASMVHIYQTCSKYGNPSHTWRIFGSTSQYDRTRKVFSQSLKLRINGCLQIHRQPFCFSCAFHMRQRFSTKMDVYGCFDSPLNAQIKKNHH